MDLSHAPRQYPGLKYQPYFLSAKNKKKYKSLIFFVFNGWLLSTDLGNVSVEIKSLAIRVVALYR